MTERNGWARTALGQLVDIEVDLLKTSIIAEITRVMTERKIGRSELARRAHCSRAYVTQTLNGRSSNLRSLCRLIVALDQRVAIRALSSKRSKPNNSEK